VSTLKTAFNLLKTRQFKEFFSITTSKLIKIEQNRIDFFNLCSAQKKQSQELELETITSEQFQTILNKWPDSVEEKERHQHLCEVHGAQLEILTFKRKGQNEPEHFHMYLNPKDSLSGIPEKISRVALEYKSVLRIRVYTFEGSRGHALGKLSTKESASYLAERYQGITAWRGLVNTDSIKMADGTGFLKIASLTRVSFPWQKGMKGLLLLRKEV